MCAERPQATLTTICPFSDYCASCALTRKSSTADHVFASKERLHLIFFCAEAAIAWENSAIHFHRIKTSDLGGEIFFIDQMDRQENEEHSLQKLHPAQSSACALFWSFSSQIWLISAMKFCIAHPIFALFSVKMQRSHQHGASRTLKFPNESLHISKEKKSDRWYKSIRSLTAMSCLALRVCRCQHAFFDKSHHLFNGESEIFHEKWMSQFGAKTRMTIQPLGHFL